MTIRAYRYQLRLKPEQERKLKRWAGALRWLWNKALAEQQARYARGEKYSSYVDMAKWLTTWRNDPLTNWLSEGPSQPQQNVLKRLDDAYKRFFKGMGGYPRFKAYGLNPGIHYSDKKSIELDAGNARLQLPKVGWIRLRMSRPLKGEIRSASLSCEGSKWYVSIQTLQGDVIPAAGLAPSVGIDMGVTLFAALSNGQTIEPLNAYKLHQCRLRRYQRSVARKVKGSCNRKKAIKKLKTLHKKIADKRSDWLHKITSAIVKEHPVIAIEDLRIKNMSKSCSGKGSQAKAGLNKGILDQAWGEFARQLDYKTQAVGGLLLKVPAAYTSQTCSKCGTVSKLNRQSQSLFLCVACGHTENADLNASSNILQRGELAWIEILQQKAAGHAASVHGETVRPSKVAKPKKAVSKKWKPTEEVVP